MKITLHETGYTDPVYKVFASPDDNLVEVCAKALRKFFNLRRDVKYLSLVVSNKRSAEAYRVELGPVTAEYVYIRVSGHCVAVLESTRNYIARLLLAYGRLYVTCYYET